LAAASGLSGDLLTCVGHQAQVSTALQLVVSSFQYLAVPGTWGPGRIMIKQTPNSVVNKLKHGCRESFASIGRRNP
jgi:hypothetical protein